MKNLLVSFFILSTIIGCQDSITTIKGCCDEPAAYDIFGSGKIFVPNVFTPNADGINDRLIIYGDSVTHIESLKIKNKDRVVVYEKEDFLPNDYNAAWDGEFAGKIETGMYSFVLEAEAIDGTVATVKGKVCVCPCVDGIDEDFAPISGCNFGICDPNWIHCDTDEYLPCFAN